MIARLFLLSLALASILRADYRGKIRILNTSSTQQGYRVKSGGATIVEDIIQPGYSSDYDFDGLSVDEVIVYRVVTGATYVGASYVAGSGEAEQLIGSGPLFSSDGPPPFTRFPFDVGGPAGPLADNKKTIWSVTDSTLTGALYREGVDKIIAGGGVTGSGGSFPAEGLGYLASSADALGEIKLRMTPQPSDITAIGNAPDSQMMLINGSGGDVGFFGRVKNKFGNVTLDTDAGTFSNPSFASASLPTPSSAAEFSFGTITVLGTEFQLKPFTFAPQMLDYLHIIRELILWGGVLAFVMYSRTLIERHMLALFATPQIQTAVEPIQEFIPGAALGKQVAVSGLWITGLVTVLAVSIGFVNTRIGSVLPEGSIWSFLGKGADVIGTATSTTGGEKAYGLFSEFIPIAALFELLVSEVIFAWSLPAVWSFVYLRAKVLYA